MNWIWDTRSFPSQRPPGYYGVLAPDWDCPGFLPMPLQGMLVMEANHRINRAGAEDLAFYPTGQVVGQMNSEKDCRSIMYELLEEYADTVDRLHSSLHADE